MDRGTKIAVTYVRKEHYRADISLKLGFNLKTKIDNSKFAISHVLLEQNDFRILAVPVQDSSD